MSIQRLLFISTSNTNPNGTTLFVTDGTTVTQLANQSSTPAFLSDPISGNFSTTVVGTTLYLTMADPTDTTSVIWSYNGTTLQQITSSLNYVYNTPDTNNAVSPDPSTSYNGDLIFSQASLATGSDNGNYDKATLAVYNPSSGQITQPSTPNSGYDPQDFVTLNGTLYFEALDSTTGSDAIYSYNGTSVTEIYNLHPTYFNAVYAGNYPAAGTVDGPLVAFNNNLYFGSSQESVKELNATTSLSNSAAVVSGSAGYSYGTTPATDLIVSNNYLFFVTPNNGVYSLSTSNAPTSLVGSIGSQSLTPVVYNNKLYFVAYAVVNNNLQPELYTSTGTSATVVNSNFNGSDFAVVGDTLYYNNNSGTTLGTINGTTIGTLAVPSGVGGQPLVVLPFAATSWGISAPHTPPAVVAGATASFTGGGSAVLLDSGLMVTDASSATLAGATVTISAGLVSGDTLNFATQNGISGSYTAATGVLTLSGTASLAAYQTALEAITYNFSPANGDPTGGGSHTSRTVSWAVTDGTASSTSVTSILNTVHAAPTVTAGATATFYGGGPAVILDGGLLTADPDSGGLLTGATVSISTRLQAGDSLNLANQNGITGSYNSTTGILTLSGSASVAAYQTALESITYSFSPGNGDPTAAGSYTGRTISWNVTDGVASSTAVSSNLSTVHVAPTVAASGTADYTVGGSPAALDPTITTADADSGGLLTGATIAISGGTFTGDDDLLTATVAGTAISAFYSAITEILTLSGRDTLAHYQAVLGSILFSSSSADPMNGGADTNRTISWSVRDGVAGSNTATTSVAILPPPPVVTGTVAGQATTDETTDQPFTSVSITDPNAAQTETVSVTLSNAANGALSNLAGGSYSTVTGVYTVTGSTTAVTSAVDGLTFTPTKHQVAPGRAVTTGFTIQVTDNAGGTASDTSTTVVAAAVNDPPVISGTLAGQATTDEAALSPFTGVGIADVDVGQTETVTVTLSAVANGTLSTLGTGSYDATSGVYRITGSDAAVTTAVDRLTFTPTAHQVAPGRAMTTGFTIHVTDTAGGTASDTSTTVVATAVNDPPVISGTRAVQTTTDKAPILPFTGVGIADADFGQTETVTVTLSDAGKGMLSTLGTGSYDATAGIYTVSGTDAAVTSAVDGLTFTPTAHQVAPGNTVTTGFTIHVTDTAGGTASDTSTTVVATAVNDPPVISGTQAGQATTDEASISPFTGVGIADVDFGQIETVTVTLSDADNGSLSNVGTGSYDSTAGVYTVSGSDAAVTAAVDGLTFTPTAHQVAPGRAVTTGFTIQVTDTAGGTASDTSTTVAATAVNDPPVISGTQAGQATTDEAALSPFTGVGIADVDFGQTETVTVTLSDADNGSLSTLGTTLGNGSYDATSGVYTVSGSDAAVTSALDALIFTPTAHQVAPGDMVTTGFTISTTDTAGGTASDTGTIVVATAADDAPVISGTQAGQTTTDKAAISPFTGVGIADADFGQTETVTVTLSAPANGMLSTLAGGSYDATAGVYTVSGTDAAVTSAVDGLTFTPTAHQVAPGDTVTTGFVIGATDTAGDAAADNGTTVVATAADDAPVISGTHAGQTTTDEASLSPFTGVGIADVDFGQTETVTVTLSDADNGSLSNLAGGSYDSTTGVYTVSGTDAAVTSAVDGLTFIPKAHQVAPGDTVTTGFVVGATDTAGDAAADNGTTVIATAVNDPPSIVIASVTLGVPNEASDTPFSGLSIVDPDVGHTDVITVTLSDPTGGTLSNLGGGRFDPTTGVYSIDDSATAVTTALQGLIFTPAAPAAGSFVRTTNFVVTVSGPGGSASNSSISVTSARQVLGLADTPAGDDVVSASPDGAGFAAPTTGKTNQAVITNPTAGASFNLPTGYQAEFVGGTPDVTLTDTTGGNALLIGNAGNDTISASAAGDTLTGGSGNNQFAASGANDVIGATGNATVSSSGSSDTVFAGAGTLALTDSGIGNRIGLSSGASTITLNGSAAVVYAGSGGTSLVDNGTGDAIGGSAGALSATLTGSGSRVYGGSGPLSLDIATGSSGVVLGLGVGSTSASIAGGNATIYGGSGSLNADITGTGAVIGLASGAANLTLAGSGTRVFGGSGFLTVDDLGHADTISAGNGSTTVTAAGSNAVVVGGGGILNFVGGAGNATVYGGTGTTTVSGGTGATTLFGSAGGDITYIGSVGAATYQAGSGNETLNAGLSSTNNVINGGIDPSGRNLLIGGSGNDSLYGGTGDDTLTGGAGTNQFVFYKTVIAGAAPTDVITDFNAKDTVFLAGYGSAEAANALASATSSAGSTTITLSDKTQITFLATSGSASLAGHLLAT